MEKVEVEVSGKIVHESGNPAKIEVTRGQRGGYGWTISLAGKDPDAVREEIKHIDAQLRADFADQEGG